MNDLPNIVKLSAHTDSDRRPVIRLCPGALHETAAEAEAALIEAGAPLYSFGGELVRPVTEEVKAFRGRRTRVVRVRPVTPDTMRDHLARVARFERYDGRAGAYVATDPPYAVAKTVLGRDGDWDFPKLNGVITTPTMRPDGSILSEPGYDPATALLLVAPPDMPVVAEAPTPAAARAALDLLQELLTEFPFSDEASHAVALSALMTPVVRGAMQTAPLHVMDAPEAGTGKSYLIDVASAISTGEFAPVIAAGRNEEESEKRLAAALLAGQAFISIDNLNGDLSGDFLCQMVERPIVRPRILGKSENKRIENAVTVYANGNNLRLVGDIVRRAVRCRLDAGLERPELRRFNRNPLKAVLADRGKYIHAALTIVRAYQIAGYPDSLPSLASFEDWSLLVRSSLVWLGLEDPLVSMAQAREDDPTRLNLQAVVTAWREVIGTGVQLTAGDLKKRAGERGEAAVVLDRALRNVALARDGSEIDAKRLGFWLSRNKDRVVDGCRILSKRDAHSKQQVWRLTEKVCGEGG
jgi:hypothetical protein